MPLTLLDIAKLNGNDALVGLIEENLSYSPEFSTIPSRTPIRGTSYYTGKRIGRPTVAFRGANEGTTPGKSTFERSLVECFILNSEIEVDKAVADAHEDGAAALQAIEASGVMQQAMIEIGQQVWYGLSADAKGFPGIKAATVKGDVTSAGDAVVVDATGSTATTASSVYAVRFGPQDVQFVPGNGAAMTLGDWRVQQIVAANNGKLTAYVNSLNAWLGLQIGSENSVRRICNLTAQTGKGLTDSLLADLLATFPAGMKPDAIFMSRRSRSQLQKSRTVTLSGSGKERPDQPTIAPLPTSYDGVPIVATDSILNTDAIE